ncbi:MAG: class II aldolase/adducin family protein [Phycisphaerae bacterium]
MVHPRVELTETLERIYAYRMTTTSGGNLSIRDEEGNVWITPARVDKGALRAGDVVCVKRDGGVEGVHQASSEFPFHRAIYGARPELKAIVHAHPVALVAFSICGEVPETRLFPQAAHVCGRVGFAKYALPGSEALGREIAAKFGEGFDCVILENHGVVVGGRSLEEAFWRFETLEFVAKTVIKARMLGGEVRYLSDEQIALAERPRGVLEEFLRPAEEASTREKGLRGELVEFIRRGYRQRLLMSTGGSFSARVDRDSFLITCYGIDRKTMGLGDLAVVRNGKVEGGKQASRAVRLHEAIYREHAGVEAVVNALPVNATAFSVTGAGLDARTIPESYLFLKDVGRVPFEEQFGDGGAVARRVSLESPAALMENNGVLVVGRSVLDAFDRLEVLESTAEAIINAGRIGKVVPMGEGVIGELRKAFGM